MTQKVKTLIIGTGFAGLAMGERLRRSGDEDFIILEKAHDVGGTWRENTYPSAECDVPSALYSYSFAPNPTWKFKWAKQDQILDYLRGIARDFDLMRHIEFGRAVDTARWDEAALRWDVTCKDGAAYRCQFLITALGQLHFPNIPRFKGRENFNGPAFHSARWDHSVDLSGKSIGVIGNAASALQFIPQIAKTAARVTVYQRTANWVLPKFDRPQNSFHRLQAKLLPGLAKFHRYRLWCMGEFGLWPTIKGSKIHNAALRAYNQWHLKKHIKDEDMRAALTPDYPIGAKRILFSDNYYDALARDNVELITDGIDHITPSGMTAQDGTGRDHDVIIYGTGFQTNPFLQGLNIIGAGGRALCEHWRDGAQAYLGITTHGFPNLFMLYGPNTNTGHTSMVYKLEAQAHYINQMIPMAGDGALDVKADIEAAFNARLQTALRGLAWNKIAASWYKDGDKITNNWGWSSWAYRKATRTPKPSDFTRLTLRI